MLASIHLLPEFYLYNFYINILGRDYLHQQSYILV